MRVARRIIAASYSVLGRRGGIRSGDLLGGTALRLLLLHPFDKTFWPHVGPMLVDVVEARGASVRCVDDGPASRHFLEARPQRMLPFVVDEHVINGVFV